MIEVKNLTKKYGDKFALKDVSFTVEPGQVLGFLGPNGAGKSTTMNILTGYLSATEGQAIIGGHDILEEPMEAKRLIGYLPEQPPLYLDMTVKEYLEFVYELKKTTLPKQQHLKEVCDVVKITDVYGRIIKHLSKGYRQRVGLAQALIGNPDVLILDEPTVGLDPKQIIDIRNLIRSLAERHTVILSSHILPEVQAVCDRILVINKGQIVADGTPDNLSAQLSGDHKLMVRIEGPENDVAKLLSSLPNVISVKKLGKRDVGVYEYAVESRTGTDVRKEMFLRLADRRWPLLSSRSSELTLEDIFLQLVREGGHQ